VHEISEHLVGRGATPVGEVRVGGRRARVALQDSCHLRNGLRVFTQPRELIAAVADFVPVAGDDSCCAAAGRTRCCARATAGTSSRASSTRSRQPTSTTS
jgi:glycolate oxidase iron-sulfur subunit